nr:MerR family DNA-binding transcriptional regulator [Kribbella jiaozuonensis]
MSGSSPGGDVRIGELAERAGVSVRSLRYYERRACSCRSEPPAASVSTPNEPSTASS